MIIQINLLNKKAKIVYLYQIKQMYFYIQNKEQMKKD